MRCKLPLMTVLSLLFVFSGMCANAVESMGPKLVIENKTFDFQKVDEGTILEHAFVVKNVGDQPLQIQKVRPG